jgi:hypothetical protein
MGQANKQSDTASGSGCIPFLVSYLTLRIRSTLPSSSSKHQHNPNHIAQRSLSYPCTTTYLFTLPSLITVNPRISQHSEPSSQPTLSSIFFDASNSASFLSTISHRKTSIIFYRRSQLLVSPGPSINFVNKGNRITSLRVPTIDNYLFLYAPSTL